MNEDFKDFEVEKNDNIKNTDNSLRTLKIFAIVFILILSVAISIYLVYSYFQNNKLLYEDKIPQTLSETEVTNQQGESVILQQQEQTVDISTPDENKEEPKVDDIDNSNLASKIESNKIESNKIEAQKVTEVKKTDLPKKESTTSTSKIYTVQIASFTDFDKAISLKNKLEKQGISCYIVIIEISGKYYYRVRSGKFKNKADAIELINRIKSIDNSLAPMIITN